MPKPLHVSRGDREEAGPPRAGRRAATERALERYARERDGIVTTPELARFGVGKDAIAQRTANGRLHRIHQGVFVVGRCSLTQRGRWRAAVAACGPEALLSHLSAAALWRLLEDARLLVDVTVTSGARSRRGIRVHRASGLTDSDRAEPDGIPVTAVARTLADLAGVVSPRTLAKAVREAEREELLDVAEAAALCGSGRKGSGALLEILRRDFAAALGARSELEIRFLELCERYHLSLPAVNVYVEGLLVDAVWSAQRVVVELDGWEYHRTRSQQRRDAERDRRLTLAGYAVLRFGWYDVVRVPASTAKEIRDLLRQRGDPAFSR